MSSAEAQASTSGGLADTMARLRASPRLTLIIGVAAAVAVLAALLLWTRSPDYTVLYSGLANRDGGQIVARLDQMQVPYKLTGGGSTIMVPRARVDRIRLQMASDGLPKGGDVGFELMDNESFGISEFAEKVNYQRALAGELERSIQTVDEVSSARVQLAIPKSSVFIRERKKPKASVVLNLYSGRALTKAQVTAIQNLVASAVPGLPVDAVTIVDGRGHLLSGDSAKGADGTRLDYAARVEKTYQKRIQNLLAPIVGADNVRTQVVADLDFARRERTRDRYSPNDGGKSAAIRSRQTSEKINKNNDPGQGRVPGALSNQPTPNAPSPINNPKKQGANGNVGNNRNGNGGRAKSSTRNASLQTSGTLGLDNSDHISTSNNATTNYELDHMVQHVTDPVGQLKRVSVAVVINQKAVGAQGSKLNGGKSSDKSGAKKADAKAGNAGKTMRGLSKAQMDQLRGLVRGAIGYSAKRGDSVEVMQMPFSEQTVVHQAATPAWWQDPRLQAMAIKAVKYLVLALAAWLLWRRLIKPLAERSGLFGEAPAPRGTTAAGGPVAADGAADAGPDEYTQADRAENARRAQRRQRHSDAVRSVQDTARNDPRMVAMIVKDWMKEDG